MKTILIMSCLFLTACGTVKVQTNGNKKLIEFTDPPYTTIDRASAFAMPSIQTSMTYTAMKQCPDGYTIQNQRFDPKKDALVWNITCLSTQERN